MKYNVMIVRFPFGNLEVPAIGTWMGRTVSQLKQNPKIEEVLHEEIDDTPITMSRNRAVRLALAKGVDLLLMLDSDIHPDIMFGSDKCTGKEFFNSSFEFMQKQKDPCIVAAPYCGVPPHENIYVFHWAGFETDTPNDHWKLEQFSRELASIQAGIQEVSAIPTGMVLMDMRIFQTLGTPWFYYEFADEFQTDKASTEDVTFSRDVSLCGFKVFCNWDCWAGHYKTKLVQKPTFLSVDAVQDKYVEAWKRNMPEKVREIQLRSGRLPQKNVPSSNGARPRAKAPKKKSILPKRGK